MLDWQDVNTWVVLVVDDEPDNLDLVVDTLGYYGATIKAAVNGKQALEVLDGFTPNLFLVDLSMPEMDGWDLFKHLREQDAFAQTPVIAMTAHAMVGDREKALAAGFDGYITKPLNIPTLRSDIRNAYITGSNHPPQ